MECTESLKSIKIAVYLDFENLAIAADQVFSYIDRPLELGPILDKILTKGSICIKRAFADWSKPDSHRYVKNLHKYGFDLRYLPHSSARGKNGADIQMVIDILEDLQFYPNIDAIIIGSGDTDFFPVIKRVLARGKPVYIVGFDDSVGDVIRDNCTEYISLNKLLQEIHGPYSDDGDGVQDNDYQDDGTSEGRNLLIRFIRSNNPEDPILLSKLKINLLRLDPSFSETNYGFKSFTSFLDSYIDDVIKERTVSLSGHPQVTFLSIDEVENQEINDKQSSITKFITKNLKLLTDPEIRLALGRNLIQCFQENPSISMIDIVNYLFERSDGVSKLVLRKYVIALSDGRVFHHSSKEYQGPLLKIPQSLNKEIVHEDQIEEIYHKRIKEILRNLYSEVDLTSVDCYRKAFGL